MLLARHVAWALFLTGAALGSSLERYRPHRAADMVVGQLAERTVRCLQGTFCRLDNSDRVWCLMGNLFTDKSMVSLVGVTVSHRVVNQEAGAG